MKINTIEQEIALEVDKMSTDSEINIEPMLSMEQKLIIKACNNIFNDIIDEIGDLRKELEDNGVI